MKKKQAAGAYREKFGDTPIPESIKRIADELAEFGAGCDLQELARDLKLIATEIGPRAAKES